jgi:hypothetical protein
MNFKTLLSLMAAGSLVFSSAAFAQGVKITGTVVAVTSTTITVQTGTQVLTVSLTPDTNVAGEKKVGSTVTITYTAPDAQHKE